MINFFLLDKNQVFGDNRLAIFNNGYLIASLSDYAQAKNTLSKTINDKKIGCWWLDCTDYKVLGTISNCLDDDFLYTILTVKGYGIRPAVNYKDIEPLVSNIVEINKDITEVEFGNYPQSYVNSQDEISINELFENNMLEKISDSFYKYNDFWVSKSEENNHWFICEPIIWVVDKNTGIALTKNILDGGKMDYKNVEQFLNQVFPKLIIANEKTNCLDRQKRYEIIKERRLSLIREKNSN